MTFHSPHGVWFWPEAGGVRAWSPASLAWFDLPAPGPEPLSASRLRDGLETLDAATALAPALADYWRALLTRAAGQPLSLCLARGLPSAWRDFPWEWLRAEGRFMHGQLVVTREAPFPEPAPGALASDRGVVLNLWPSAEPIQPAAGLHERWPGLRERRTRKLAEQYLTQGDPQTDGLLIVIAHGSEASAVAPFRLPDGEDWALPTARGLPALVILLACGSDDGNLLAYGRTLLAAGARAVLAPVGQLDARAASASLRALLDAWLTQGTRLDEALRRAQTADAGSHGARRLCLLGEAGLYAAATTALEALDDARLDEVIARELADDGPPVALPLRCERLTLYHYQKDGSLDDLRTPFPKANEPAVLQRLGPVAATLSPAARQWVLPALAYLAEVHDPDWLPRLESLRAALERESPGGRLPPAAHHHWAKSHYRQGRYGQAAAELAAGLSRLEPGREARDGAGLMGALLNVLNDQALVEPARQAEHLLEHWLANQSGADIETLRLKHRDRRARLLLRSGRGEGAQLLWHRRWRENEDAGQPDDFALTWLLYLAAWYPCAEGQAYRDAVLESWGRLLPEEELKGNHNALYQMRALAAWAWRHDDAEVAAALAGWIPWCDARLLNQPRQDPGPVGFTLLYLRLHANRNAPAWAASLPPLGRVTEALREWRYHLELAAFAALRGAADDARQAVEAFQRERRQVTAALRDLPPELGFPDWDATLDQAETRERAALLDDLPATPERLAASGLLPL